MHGAVALLLGQQTGEIESCGLLVISLALDEQFCMSHYIIEMGVSQFSQILSHFLCKEGEIIYQILIFAYEVGAEVWVLSCHSQRTGVEITFAHHHATKHNKCQCAEAKLFSSEQGHGDDVATSLELTVYLQTHMSA